MNDSKTRRFSDRRTDAYAVLMCPIMHALRRTQNTSTQTYACVHSRVLCALSALCFALACSDEVTVPSLIIRLNERLVTIFTLAYGLVRRTPNAIVSVVRSICQRLEASAKRFSFTRSRTVVRCGSVRLGSATGHTKKTLVEWNQCAAPISTLAASTRAESSCALTL